MLCKQSRNLEQLQEQYCKYEDYGTFMQRQLFEHFSEEGHRSILKMSLLHRLTKLTNQTLYGENNIGELPLRQCF